MDEVKIEKETTAVAETGVMPSPVEIVKETVPPPPSSPIASEVAPVEPETENLIEPEPSPVFPETAQPPVFPEQPIPKRIGRPPGSKNKKSDNLHNVRDAKGHFIPGPPPKANFDDLLGAQPPGQSPLPNLNGEVVDYTKLAEITFALSTGMLSGVFGPEWQPESEEEKKSVVLPLAAYYKSKDVSDLPPGVLLAVVVGAYSIRRLPKPGTSNKIKAAWFWVKSKFTRKKPFTVV
jgi:hypothetical protein